MELYGSGITGQNEQRMTRKSTLPERPSLRETKASSVALLLLLPLSFMVLPESDHLYIYHSKNLSTWPNKSDWIWKLRTPKTATCWVEEGDSKMDKVITLHASGRGKGADAEWLGGKCKFSSCLGPTQKTTQYLKRADPSLLACCVLGPLKFKAESEFFSPNFPWNSTYQKTPPDFLF